MDWWIVVLIAVQFTFFAFLLWLAASYRQKSLERRSEERLRVLERFSSGQELADFLATDRGGRFLGQFAVKPRNPAGLIVAGVVLGILAAALAVAFLLLTVRVDENFFVPAAILLAAAVGILVATLVSARLARRYALLPPGGERAPDLDVE
jgi:hypothetical protein